VSGRFPFLRNALLAALRLVARLFALTTVIVAGGTAIALCLSLAIPGVALVGSSVEVAAPKLPDANRLKERSVVYDRNGREIAVWRSEENRVVVEFAAVPQHLVDAILAVEDANFYLHGGVSVKATGRAMLENLSSGQIEQGGSTITQQLVKISRLNRNQKLDRKVREARLAIELEKVQTKDEILELYLNSVYFGGGAYGVEAAANYYFGKPVGTLTVGDSAFLAGMIRNPTGYDPVRFRDRSRLRRSVVLSRMVDVEMVTRKVADEIGRSPMPFPQRILDTEVPGTYFLEQVKQELLDDPRLGDTEGERYQAVFNGGLRIYTTFDPVLQAAAEQAVLDVIPDKSEDEFTASLVSIDVDTSAVRAMAAGRGFETDRYNLVTQARRQPGSSWKPFTLIAAMEAGYSPTSTISGNEPCPIPNPEADIDPYEPNNYSDSAGFTGSLTDQLVNSSNCAYARLNAIVGTQKVISVARRLGITSRLDPVPALSLGTEEVRPIEMVGAYATIARDGEFLKPYLVERVEDVEGNVLWRAPRSGKQVLNRDIARAATQSMREVVRRGTGTEARLGNDRQVAGKTGTTQNYEDAWFIGYTSQIATVIWMGSPVGKVAMRGVGGISVSGGSYPAKIWREYMSIATDNQPVVDFFEPVNEDALGKSECLQLEKPEEGYDKWRPERKTTKTTKTTKSTTKSSNSTKSTEAAGIAEDPEVLGSFGRFGVVFDLRQTAESPATKKSTTKKSTTRKRSYSCSSWGDEYSSSGGSSSSTKPTKKKTTKKATTKKSTDSDSSSDSEPVTRKKSATSDDDPAQPIQRQADPVPEPEPIPVPVPVESPVPVVE
jgi:penicillin-binding protein 1A